MTTPNRDCKNWVSNPGGNFDIGGVPANIDDSSTDLALQGTAGINMALGGGKLGAQYRYIWTDTGGNNSDEITAHAFTLHYMFSF